MDTMYHFFTAKIKNWSCKNNVCKNNKLTKNLIEHQTLLVKQTMMLAMSDLSLFTVNDKSLGEGLIITVYKDMTNQNMK